MFIYGICTLLELNNDYSIAENARERERKDLINELQIMVTVGDHPNVVSLIGACTKSGNY